MIQNFNYQLDPGAREFETIGEADFIFVRFADREFDLVINNQTVTMERGAEYTHPAGMFHRFEIHNKDPENPATIRLAIGTARYRSRIITGEVTVTPGLRKADGTFVPDTRHDITLDLTVTDDTVSTWSKNQEALSEPYTNIEFDGNWSIPVADEKYLYFLTPSGSNPGPSVTVLDLFTLDVIATHDHDFYADGIGSIKNAVIHEGRCYAAVKSTGSTWQGPAGSTYDWHGIVSWPISGAGLGSITVHADDWPKFGTIVASVLRNTAKDNWLVQRDDQWKEVSTLDKASIDGAAEVMSEANSQYGDSKCFFVTDYERIYIDGQLFDANTLEHLGSRGIGSAGSELGIAYSATTGLFYLVSGSDFVARSWASGNKWAGAIHVSAGCQGGRRTRKKGVILRLPISYSAGDWGPEFSGPLIKAALQVYRGEAPPADYLDHIYKLVIDPRVSPPTTVYTGSETFDKANVADDFTAPTPVRLTLTIDNDLFNGE